MFDLNESVATDVTNAAKSVVSGASKAFDEHFNKVQANAKHDLAALQLRINAVKTSADKVRLSTEINNNIKVFSNLHHSITTLMQNEHNKTNTNYKKIVTWADNTLGKFKGLSERLEKKVISH